MNDINFATKQTNRLTTSQIVVLVELNRLYDSIGSTLNQVNDFINRINNYFGVSITALTTLTNSRNAFISNVESEIDTDYLRLKLIKILKN